MIKELLQRKFNKLGKVFTSNLESTISTNYATIEDRVEAYKQDFQSKYSVQTYTLLNEAIDNAYNGFRWHMSQSYIKDAAHKDKSILIEDLGKIREVWEECAPIKANANMSNYLSEALTNAQINNRNWTDIQMYIDIAQDYAHLGNLQISQDKVNEIRDVWEKTVSFKEGGKALLLDKDWDIKLDGTKYF